MRKDIFVVGCILLGIWELAGALSSLANLVGVWIWYTSPQSYNSKYYLLHLGVELFIGLYLILRPYDLFHFIERFIVNDNEDQVNDLEVTETESEVK